MKNLIFVFCIMLPSLLQAESIFINAVNRYENRKASQWLLIQPNRRDSLFEQWFPFNAYKKNRAYEWAIFVGYDYGWSNQDSELSTNFNTDDNQYAYYASGWWSILGLEYRSEKARDQYRQRELLGNVRVLGYNLQTTNLLFQFGNRWLNQEDVDKFSNFFIGIDAQLYIFRFFGVDFNWRMYFSDEGRNTSESLRSNRLSLILFFEIDFMRLYFDWSTENINHSMIDRRNGGTFGIRLYY